MSYPINYPTPQGANVQIFREGGSTSDWVKPQGASFVWFTLIGGGGYGSNFGNAVGGGSSAVTNFMCPAFLIPNLLQVNVGSGGVILSTPAYIDATASTIVYQQKDGTGYTLLTADFGKNGRSGAGAGGAAMAANAFTAMGFFQSIVGQDGTNTTAVNSPITFLSAGGNGAVPNYGYPSGSPDGYFQMQPIIVGKGGGYSGTTGYKGGIGCGGGANENAGTPYGGDGLVVIITW